MKRTWYCLIFVFALMAIPVEAQVDWTSCKKITDQFTEQIKQFNDLQEKLHTGIRLSASCMYSNPDKPAPKKTYPLTAEEIAVLKEVRANSHAAYEAEEAYIKFLLRKHGHPALDFSDRCWHYIGIIAGDDFITEDPTTTLDRKTCPLEKAVVNP